MVRPALHWLGERARLAYRLRLSTGVLLALFGVVMVSGYFTRLTEISARLLPFQIPLGM
jgi:hypothetical protein